MRIFVTIQEASDELDLEIDDKKLIRKVNEANAVFDDYLILDISSSDPRITSACIDYIDYLYNKIIGVKSKSDIDVEIEYFASESSAIPSFIESKIRQFKKVDTKTDEDSSFAFI